MSGNDNVIRVMCPNLTCKRILAVPTTARGKLVRCRGCGINLRIPSGKPVTDAPAAADASKTPAPAAKAAPGQAPSKAA